MDVTIGRITVGGGGGGGGGGQERERESQLNYGVSLSCHFGLLIETYLFIHISSDHSYY